MVCRHVKVLDMGSAYSTVNMRLFPLLQDVEQDSAQ
jgi:hypothetical protein